VVNDDHRELHELIGAYLLGELDEAEMTRMHDHIDQCATCRQELLSLQAIATALDGVSVEGLDVDQTPDSGLEQRVIDAIGLERRRERRQAFLRIGAAAAAACLLAVLGFAAGTAVDRDGLATPPVGVTLEPVTVDSPRGVIASADLVDHTWGLEIKLEATGLPDGVRYVGVVRDAAGREFPAGAFIGVTGTTVLCNMTTSVLRADAVSFVVRAPDGQTVLRSQLA